MAGFFAGQAHLRRRQILHLFKLIDHYLIDKIQIIILVCILQHYHKCLKNTELEMDFFRCLLATLLLVFSGQSLALFMPDGFKVSTDTAIESEEGCGLIVSEHRIFGEI